MSAYGMNTCEFCDQQYHDLDEHECDVADLKNKIIELKEEITSLHEDMAGEDL
jgi:predicted metal-binding protein